MISIIIPTFNRAYIIGRTIDSILNQLYTDWECLIVDDYSSDNTEHVVSEYQSRDKRIRFLRNNRSKGAQGARNTGILAAEGEWVVLFDSDNVMHPDFLQRCSSILRNNEIDVVTTWSNVIDSNSLQRIFGFEWINNGMIHNYLLSGKCYVDNSSTIIRKSKIIEIGLLSEDCPAFQEWDTHIRLSQICKYMTIEEYLIDYYAGAADAISSDSIKDVKGYLYILGKFKKGWMEFSRLYFIKYLALVRYKMSKVNIEQNEIYRIQYNKVAGRYKPIVYVLSKILGIKKTLMSR